LNGGHFGLLATGVDNLTIDNVKVDTNRDGFDIDSSRNVRISNCSVNSPNDDAIVLKSSYALGFARATENVTITNCLVSGYDIGSLLDGSYKRIVIEAPDRDGPTGRIKLGTESNGGFKNIAISNILFRSLSRAGARNCRWRPARRCDDHKHHHARRGKFTDLPAVGRRMRAPADTPVGRLRRVNISDIVAYNADPRYASIIAGIPDHQIEDVTLSNIRIFYRGGGRKEQAEGQPPERETNYPEPSMFGELPAYGFFVRHARGIDFNNVTVSYLTEEMRPPFLLADVTNAKFNSVTAYRALIVPIFVLRSVSDFTTNACGGVPNMHIDRVAQQNF